jgi:hypothetical protein
MLGLLDFDLQGGISRPSKMVNHPLLLVSCHPEPSLNSDGLRMGDNSTPVTIFISHSVETLATSRYGDHGKGLGAIAQRSAKRLPPVRKSPVDTSCQARRGWARCSSSFVHLNAKQRVCGLVRHDDKE